MGVELLHVALRALANRWLIETCTIQRPTETSGPDGISQSWATVATGVRCSLQARDLAPNEQVTPRGGVGLATTWRIRVPAGQDVAPQDRILIGSRTFEVQGVVAKTFEVRRAVLCVETT